MKKHYLILAFTLHAGILFSQTQNIKKNKSNTIYTSNIIDLREKGDTIEHHKGDNSPCMVLSEIIYNSILSGKIHAYDDSLFKIQLDTSEVKQICIHFQGDTDKVRHYDFDTIRNGDHFAVNRIAGPWYLCITDYGANYFNTTEYKILTVKRKMPNGSTKLQNVGIAPLRKRMYFIDHDRDKNIIGKIAWYWLKYDDLKELLAQYVKQPNHNNNNIDNIFESYFK